MSVGPPFPFDFDTASEALAKVEGLPCIGSSLVAWVLG